MDLNLRPRVRASWLVAGATFLLLGLFAALLQPDGARAYVYWSNSSGAIARANLDGSGVNPQFIVGAGAAGITVSPDYIYWANAAGGSIGRARIDGTEVEPAFVSGINDPTDIAVDGNYIYWSSFSPGKVGRASLDGSNVNDDLLDTFALGGANPSGLAVNASHIYWANAQPGSVGRADLDGGNANPTLIGGYYLAGGIAIDGSGMFFLNKPNNGPEQILHAGLDGSGPTSILGGLEGTARLALDATHVYWTDYQGGTIGRAGLDGSAPDPEFISAGVHPSGLAVDMAATAEASPGRLAFGVRRAVLPGRVSAASTVRLTNKGGSALVVSGFNVQGQNRGDFSATIGTCDAPVAPGSSCAIKVRFSPERNGLRRAVLSVITNSPTDPLITLSGRAGDSVPPDTWFSKAPPGRSRDRTPSASFRSNEKGVTFLCQMDRRPWVRCPGRKTFRVRPGGHVIRVKAKDRAGNVDRTPAKRFFVVRP